MKYLFVLIKLAALVVLLSCKASKMGKKSKCNKATEKRNATRRSAMKYKNQRKKKQTYQEVQMDCMERARQRKTKLHENIARQKAKKR